MMLVVPLSSCITDNSNLSDNSGTLSGTAPTPPTSPFTPGKYTIEYHDGDKSFSKTYNGTFAYAARLPDGWTALDGKVFAGWSKTNPNSIDSPSTIGEEVPSPDYDYLVYDDIKYDEVTGIPIAADQNNILNLYAVWITPADGTLNTVYVSENGSGNRTGVDSTNAVAGFNNAYAKLDPNGTTTTNRIILCGNVNLNDIQTFFGLSGSNIKATISAENNNFQILFKRGIDCGIGLRANTIFENISFGLHGSGVNSTFIYCNGYSLTIGENVNTDAIGSRGDNTSYGIPNNYNFITICAGGLGWGQDKKTGDYLSYYSKDTDVTQPNMSESSRSSGSPAIIKLLSGEFGRVSGSGRSYNNSEANALANPLYSRIIVWGDDSQEHADYAKYHANIGTLAGGHIDSNISGGAKIEVRSGKVINLIGGNIGNSAPSTFFGNVEITVYDGTIGVIYGAGLGRQQKDDSSTPQVTHSGTVTINICGGTIGSSEAEKLIKTSGNVYGGGAASQTVFKTPENYTYSTESKITVNIFGGKILGNVYGGGYGYSEYIKQPGMYNALTSGLVDGDIFVNILGDTTIGTYDSYGILQEGGNVYGGGKGYFATGSTNTSTAQVSGNTNVNIFSGNLGSVYGGGEGIDEYQDIAKVSVYDANGKLLRQEDIIDYTRTNIKGEYASLSDFIRKWKSSDKKKTIEESFTAMGIDLKALKVDQGMEDVDDFDFICYVAYGKKPLTRKERASNVKKKDFFSKYSADAQAVLGILLDKYMNQGITEVEDIKVLSLADFADFGKPAKIVKLFGGKAQYEAAIKELEENIYEFEVG